MSLFILCYLLSQNLYISLSLSLNLLDLLYQQIYQSILLVYHIMATLLLVQKGFQ